MKKWAILLAWAACAPCFAGNFTSWAVPTRVDVVRNEGVMVYGSFGNANGCTVADQFFIPVGHAQYNQIYALLMTALASGMAVQAYVDQCAAQDWYTVPSNTMDPCCSIYLRNQ